MGGIERSDGGQRVVQGSQESAFRRAMRKGKVEVEALSRPLTLFTLITPEERIVKIGVCVDRAERHARVLIKYLLCPVPVVIVNVENGDPLARDLLQGSGRYGRIVQVTESAVQIMPGVMARRPTQSVSCPRAAAHQVSCCDRTLGAPVRCHPGAFQDRAS